MVTEIHNWGNSLGLRIPKSFAAEANVEEGSTVDIPVVNGGLAVRAIEYVPERWHVVWLRFGPQAGPERAGHRK